ncbi:MAG: MFS transporter [Coprothermobacterota bacterium]|nr:MFS transporter [Coprothermobacterota bacterium]
MEPVEPKPRMWAGMRDFFIVWAGQFFSLFGSNMTRFALTIWAYQITGQATSLAMMAFFTFGPEVFMSPIAGALVDRWNRKLTMALSDIAIGVTTIVILVLFLTGNLQIWHLYLLGAIAGIFTSFQWPAYSAAITLMVPKHNYARASAMISLAESSSGILSPIFAAALIGLVGIAPIFVIDLATLAIALGALWLARIPKPPRSEAGREGAGSLWKESLFGFRYIFSKPSLLGLQLIFLFGNMFSNLAWIVFTPMVLAQTGNNVAILGAVESVGGIGGVIGGVALSIWGGFKRKTDGVFLGWAVPALISGALIGLGRSPLMWGAGVFLGAMLGPVVNASNQAIWQSKVPPDIQGRVFSVRRLIAQVVAPLSLLAAGPLADKVFEPAMATTDSALGGILGPFFGTGPGAGMAVMLLLFSLLVVLVGLSGYLFPAIRDVEKIIPDYDMVPVAGSHAVEHSPE